VLGPCTSLFGSMDALANLRVQVMYFVARYPRMIHGCHMRWELFGTCHSKGCLLYFYIGLFGFLLEI
jgi:hypothetical protein